jgi:hypothetical protein
VNSRIILCAVDEVEGRCGLLVAGAGLAEVGLAGGFPGLQDFSARHSGNRYVLGEQKSVARGITKSKVEEYALTKA